MLKFTKYGRKASMGSFDINAVQTSAVKPPDDDDSLNKHDPDIKLSSFKKICNEDEPVPEQVQSEVKRPEESIDKENVDSGEPLKPSQIENEQLSTLPPQRHLSFSKVPREELLQMNSSLNLDTHPEGGAETVKKMKRVRFSASTIDACERKEKEMKLKQNLESRKLSSNKNFTNVSVYNDDYFPRVKPLQLYLTRVESDMKKKKHSIKFKIFKF